MARSWGVRRGAASSSKGVLGERCGFGGASVGVVGVIAVVEVWWWSSLCICVLLTKKSSQQSSRSFGDSSCGGRRPLGFCCLVNGGDLVVIESGRGGAPIGAIFMSFMPLFVPCDVVRVCDFANGFRTVDELVEGVWEGTCKGGGSMGFTRLSRGSLISGSGIPESLILICSFPLEAVFADIA